MKWVRFINKHSITNTLWGIILIVSLLYLPDKMTFLENPYKASDNPPWYFILNDLRYGLSSLIGLVLSLLLIFIYYRDMDGYSLDLLFFTLIFYLYNVGKLISIYYNSTDVFNLETAETNWMTYSQYQDQPWTSFMYILVLIVIAIVYRYFKKKLKIEGLK